MKRFITFISLIHQVKKKLGFLDLFLYAPVQSLK